MDRVDAPVRKRLTMIEVAILLIILVILGGISLSALVVIREAALRTNCTGRLRQIGGACNEYESKHGHFPADNYPTQGRSFLWAIRGYLDLEDVPIDQPAPAAEPFLCPSRRTVQDLGAQTGPSDYGCGNHPGKYRSILAGPETVTTVKISNTGGTSNKLLVGHLGVRPSDYKRGVEAGESNWATGPLSRDPSQFVQDNDESPMNRLLGTPHPKASPFLFADGAVRLMHNTQDCVSFVYFVDSDKHPVKYQPENYWFMYWGYNDPAPIPNSELPR